MTIREEEFEAPDVGVPGPEQREAPAAPETPPAQPKPDAETTLAKTLEKLNAQTQQVSMAQQLLVDPNIRAYLQAKQEGKQVKLVDADEPPAKPAAPAEPETPPDLESMTNAQLVEWQMKQMKRLINDAVSTRTTESVNALKNEITPKLNQVADATAAQQRAAANAEIAAVKARYKDFDEVRPMMASLNQTVRGLTVEELYHMAKLRAGLPPIPQTVIETERPSAPASNRIPYKRPEKISGRSGFQSILDAALKRSNEQE